MSRTQTLRRPTGHDYQYGEVVTLKTRVGPFEAGTLVQVVGFRGNTLLRLLPVAGIPVLASHEAVERTGLAGSHKPPRRRFIRRQPRPQPPQPACAPLT